MDYSVINRENITNFQTNCGFSFVSRKYKEYTFKPVKRKYIFPSFFKSFFCLSPPGKEGNIFFAVLPPFFLFSFYLGLILRTVLYSTIWDGNISGYKRCSRPRTSPREKGRVDWRRGGLAIYPLRC
jgi:hypothetical protein